MHAVVMTSVACQQQCGVVTIAALATEALTLFRNFFREGRSLIPTSGSRRLEVTHERWRVPLDGEQGPISVSEKLRLVLIVTERPN